MYQIFQNLDCGANVLVAVSGSDGRLEKLTGQPGQRQRDTQILTRFQHEPDVLVHPLDTEVGGKVSGENKRRFVADKAALGGAVVEDFQHQFGVHTAFGGKHHAFVEGHEDVGKHQIL